MGTLNKMLLEEEQPFPKTEEIINNIKSLISDLLGSDSSYYLTATHRRKLYAIEHKIEELESRANYGK